MKTENNPYFVAEECTEKISERQFAKRLNKYLNSIQSARKSGHFTYSYDPESKKYIWPVCYLEFFRNREDLKINSLAAVPAGEFDFGDYNLKEAQAKKLYFEAELAEMEAKEKSGELLSRRELEEDSYQLGVSLRERILAIPDRQSDLIASDLEKLHEKKIKIDRRICYTVIKDRLRKDLKETSELLKTYTVDTGHDHSEK